MLFACGRHLHALTAIGDSLPIVSVDSRVAALVRAGHPWVYREALRGDLPAAGERVEVTERPGGAFVGRGYADPCSPIAVRVLTTEEDEAIDDAFVARRVDLAIALRAVAGVEQSATAYRVIHGEGDRLPGIVVDRYGPQVLVEIDTPAAAPMAEAAGRIVAERLGVRVVGPSEAAAVEVEEHGVRFAVTPGTGHKTGLFLDQRDNRAAFARRVGGRTVLDAFSYVGAFSMHALSAGAASATLVDSAAPALEAARRNAALNGIDATRIECIAGDAFERLDAMARQGRRFGAVVLDPPSFAPSERAKKKALVAYRRLNALGLRVAEPGAVFATSSCSSHVTIDELLAALRDAAAEARRDVRILEIRGAGADHPTLPAFAEGRYLKFVLGWVAGAR